MDGCLGCFYVLVIVPGTAVNADVQILIRIIVLSGYMPRGRVAGPHGYFVLSSLNFPNCPSHDPKEMYQGKSTAKLPSAAPYFSVSHHNVNTQKLSWTPSRRSPCRPYATCLDHQFPLPFKAGSRCFLVSLFICVSAAFDTTVYCLLFGTILLLASGTTCS